MEPNWREKWRIRGENFLANLGIFLWLVISFRVGFRCAVVALWFDNGGLYSFRVGEVLMKC